MKPDRAGDQVDLGPFFLQGTVEVPRWLQKELPGTVSVFPNTSLMKAFPFVAI